MRWIVCCVFEGFLKVIVRHADHGGTLINWYPGTLVPVRDGYPGGTGTRVPGYPAQTPGGLGADPVTRRTRPGNPDGYPGPTRTGGTPSMYPLRSAFPSNGSKGRINSGEGKSSNLVATSVVRRRRARSLVCFAPVFKTCVFDPFSCRTCCVCHSSILVRSVFIRTFDGWLVVV